VIRLALLFFPMAALAADPAIRVEGYTLSGEAITRRAAQLRAEGRTFQPEQLVEALIDEAVLAADARRTGLDRNPGVVSAVEQEVARALANLYTEKSIAKAVSPTESDLLAVYHDRSDTVRLLMVVVETEAEAKVVKARLASGGEFALEAARSLDPRSSSRKGDTGSVSRMELDPALAKVAFEAPVGSLVGPVALEAGFAVARIVSREQASAEEFKARRATIEESVRKRGIASARKHLAEMQRTKAGATVDTAFLQALGSRPEPSKDDLAHAFATIDGRPLLYRALYPRVRALGSGHLQNTASRTALAWSAVDERLLAKAAREAGLATSPEAQIDVAAGETQALAMAMADDLRRALPAAATPQEREDAVRNRLRKLRKDLKIQVDRKAAVAAAGTPR
jgi:hypothetical protein